VLNKSTAAAEGTVETICDVISFKVIILTELASFEEGQEPGERKAICSMRTLVIVD
jgi:hypothetical protein